MYFQKLWINVLQKKRFAFSKEFNGCPWLFLKLKFFSQLILTHIAAFCNDKRPAYSYILYIKQKL